MILPASLSGPAWLTVEPKKRSTVSEAASDYKLSRMQLILPAILSKTNRADWGAENKKYGSETAKDT